MNPATTRFVCFFDCDNTLLDNDALKDDLDRRLRAFLNAEQATQFWAAYEAARHTVGMVDYPLTVKQIRPTLGDSLADRVWDVVWNYPFPDRLYPGTLAAIAHMRHLGCAVGIVSDGDSVYQPHKIQESGLAAAVDGHVKIFQHKQDHIDELLNWLPGDHYLFVDDKASILAAMERLLGARLTTIQVRQGHYRDDRADPAPNIVLDHIGDLLRLSREQLAR